jgi:GPH family glycoside/pentoside/hexuronide:cation symporter
LTIPRADAPTLLVKPGWRLRTGAAEGADTFPNRLWFGVGQGGEGVATAGMAGLLMFFYNQVLGLDPRLAGLAMLVSMVSDGVTDLLVGSWSDRLRHPWGRRHPLMYAAAVPFGLSFAALFLVPGGLGQTGLFLWLLAASFLCRNVGTFFIVPHYALGAELSQDHHARTAIVAFRSFFAAAGRLLVFVAGVIIFTPSRGFKTGQLDPAHYPLYGLTLGVVIAVTSVLSAWGTHGTIPHLPKPVAGERFSVAHAFRDMWRAATNRAFQVFLGGFIVWVIGHAVYSTLMVYLSTYFWRLSSQQVFLLPLVGGVATLIGTPIWAVLARPLGKKATFILAGVGFSGVMALLILSKVAGLFPAEGSALYLAIVFGGTFAAGLFDAAPAVVAGSMLADIADDYELQSGVRREGVLFGAINFSVKIAGGAGAFVGGVLIAAAGLKAKADPASVPWSVSQHLAFTTVLVLVGFALAASLFYVIYPLTRSRHAGVQAALAERRRVQGSTPPS